MLIPITNDPRNYDWGSYTAIAELLGKSPSGFPEAELWLGTHESCPTRITAPHVAGGHTVLAEWIAEHTEATADGAGKLPFLLKILAADQPLSLQAHPDPQQAREGFKRENELGIPLTSPIRNYKDDQAKPEIIVAVSDTFEALAGFQSAQKCIETISTLDNATVEALSPLVTQLRSGLRAAVEWILLSEQAALEKPLLALVRAAANNTQEASDPLATVKTLAPKYPGDRGLLLALLLNKVTLRRGEGLFLPARNIHAYLRGVGVELMGASDNVLRGGLTSKHVDPVELINTLDFDEAHQIRLEPRTTSGTHSFEPEGVPFKLVRINGKVPSEIALSGPAVAACLTGSTSLRGRYTTTQISKGQFFHITPDETTISDDGGAEIFIAMST